MQDAPQSSRASTRIGAAASRARSARPSPVENVVGGGYCVGCGACAAAPRALRQIRIRSDRSGFYVAELPAERTPEMDWADATCPFASEVREDEIAARLFGDGESAASDVIGFSRAAYAGHSAAYRKFGSSGGLATWLLADLLSRKVVDGVFHVGRTGRRDPLFDYALSTTVEQVLARSTSIYYPVRIDGVIEQIRKRPGRYAITAIPCFAKALRLAAAHDPILAERVVCIVGIVCGQLKSKLYVDYLARRAGTDSPVRDACFRCKVPGERADNYAFEATYHDIEGRRRTAAIANRAIGANWGMGYFKPKACDYCDDVFAETADVALMDAWLPQFVTDGEGTSLAIVRSKAVHEAFSRGVRAGELRLVGVTENDLIASQAGGLSHRRVGLRYRLSLAGRRWVPPKRVQATNRLHWSFRLDQRLRMLLRAASTAAMRRQLRSRGMRSFDRVMAPLQLLYKASGRVKARCNASSGGSGIAAPFELDRPLGR